MTVVERIPANPRSLSVARATAQSRDSVIDAMRGIAILMVIGIHSLPQPLDAAWAKSLDAALRPCVPVFLFVSGYLTALSGRVPLAKRLKAALIPYAIAFAAAYAYMALHNPAMDHRIGTAFARFALGYVFVYYYVFVYVCCTLALWLVYAVGGTGPDSRQRIAALLILSIGCGLLAGAYLDPAISRLGASDGLLDEVRMRDIPFWFSFVALGALTAMFTDLTDQGMRRALPVRHAGGLHGLCRRAHSRPWRRRYLLIRSPSFSMQAYSAFYCSRSGRDRRCLAGSAPAATSSISGTSSSSWRCAITPRCASSATSPAFSFAAA